LSGDDLSQLRKESTLNIFLVLEQTKNYAELYAGLGKYNFLKNLIFSIFILPGQKILLGLGQKISGTELGLPLMNCGSEECLSWAISHLYQE